MIANFEELEIDEEFKKLIPHLTHEEEEALTESISKFNGCYIPLIAWRDGERLWLLDGHHRYHICQRFKFTPEVTVLNFEDRNEAMIWMIEHQLSRRNLGIYQKGKLALLHENTVAERAKQNQKGCITGDNPINTGKELAEGYGIGRSTYYKIKNIEEKATDEEKEKLSRGEITINALNNKLKEKEETPTSNPEKTLLFNEEDEREEEAIASKKPTKNNSHRLVIKLSNVGKELTERNKKEDITGNDQAQIGITIEDLIELIDYVPVTKDEDVA